MTKPRKSLRLSGSILALASLALFTAAQADAQRRAGGGGGARAGSMSRGSMSGASSRQVRSSASSSLNYGGNKANRGSGQMAGNNARPSTGAINTGNVNSGNRTNINTGNINTGDVNINRDVDIDVDNGWGCCGYGDWDYHPVAAGVAIGTAVAVTNAWRLGAYYSTLPTSCVVIYRGSVTYYQCGTYWYQPVYSGMTVQYVAVATPK